MDKQEKRIAKILKNNEIPSVSYETLDTYCDYIQKNITYFFIRTGIESMGYFSCIHNYFTECAGGTTANERSTKIYNALALIRK